MSEGSVHLRVTAGVATLTLDRPDKRNALDRRMLEQLLEHLALIDRDDAVRVVLLRAEGAAFCAGVDLAEQQAARARDGFVDYDLLPAVFRALDAHRNPTVAAVQGVALAGGLELALHCDIRIASTAARAGMPLARLGLVVPWFAAERLVALCGIGGARDLLLTAEVVDAARAERLGLFTRVVEADRLEAQAAELAASIARLAPLALRGIKRVLTQTHPADPTDIARLDAERLTVSRSDDAAEGLAAFLERRTPVFHGR
jgi:enoyl-CoA hydratase/carnithine racemase